jgi:hypothetical protein
MKATELRIGNLTQDSKGNLLKVIGLTDDNISYYVVDRSKFPLEVGWQAEPIPLTEEWLVKFGLNEIKENDPHFSNIFGNPHWIQYLERIKGVVLHIGGGEHFTIENINHVHQLQNLVHALTGEELTIK